MRSIGLATIVAVCTPSARLRRALGPAAAIGIATVSATAFADEPQPEITVEQAQAAINIADQSNKNGGDQSTLPVAPQEAPPPPPRKKGLVLEQSLGAVGWVGKFGGLTGHPGIWLKTQLGYELFKWLMLFGASDLGFTDTGDSTGPAQNRPLPILGFSGGVRFTIPFTNRVGMFVQGEAGGDIALVKSGVLTNFGYHPAESVGFMAGGRLGFEWFQTDRHLALGVSGGARYMANLAYEGGGDLPLAWDASIDLRYTF